MAAFSSILQTFHISFVYVQEKLDVNSVTCSVSRQVGLTLDDDIKIHIIAIDIKIHKAKHSAFKSKQIRAKRHPIVERFAKNFAT